MPIIYLLNRCSPLWRLPAFAKPLVALRIEKKIRLQRSERFQEFFTIRSIANHGIQSLESRVD
jgi:hypothetical protein